MIKYIKKFILRNKSLFMGIFIGLASAALIFKFTILKKYNNIDDILGNT
jgi:hypothetical protein